MPVIAPLAALLATHEGAWINGFNPTRLLHRWRQLRDDLGFGAEVVSNTLRHTVASHLMWREAEPMHISELLGHYEPTDSLARYRVYAPTYIGSVIAPLTALWNEVHAEADQWSARYKVVDTLRGRKVIVRQADFELRTDELSRFSLRDGIPPRILARERDTGVGGTGRMRIGAMPIGTMGERENKARSAFFRARHSV